MALNSDNAQRKVDERVEAKILEVACGSVPKGHRRWTLRLLEAQMKMILDESISREVIRRTLKKQLRPPATTTGASQRKKIQNSWPVWKMFWMFMSFLTIPKCR